MSMSMTALKKNWKKHLILALLLIVSGTHNHTGWHPIPLHIICSLADHQLAPLYA